MPAAFSPSALAPAFLEYKWFSAELSYTQTQGNVFTSLVGLYKAMGGGWVVTAEQYVPALKLSTELGAAAGSGK